MEKGEAGEGGRSWLVRARVNIKERRIETRISKEKGEYGGGKGRKGIERKKYEHE